MKSKTAYAALGGILIAVGMGLSGQMEWSEAWKIVFEGVIVLFLRDGIAKRS
jgi:sulfite exporter TauE/SafE